MRDPKFWLFVVPWMGGVLVSIFPASWLGLWPGIAACVAIGVVLNAVFDLILCRYWTRKHD